MRKKIYITLGILVGILGVFLVVVAVQPSDFRVERSIVVDAEPSVVFSHVNDFHQWEDWSPWAKLDPNAENTFEGPDAGEGAIFKWSGNDDVGEGKMTILKSDPTELVRIKLEFIRPYEDTCSVEFTFQPAGEEDKQTTVTWLMFGKQNFVSKAICLFMDMDDMVGGDFERGLAQMKAVAEADNEANAAETDTAEETDDTDPKS